MRNWFNKQPRKRALARNSRLAFCAAEGLEQRAMMSAVMDNGAEVAEISHVETRKAAVSYPNVAGNWLFQVESAVINLTDFPVTITQKGAKYTVTGSADGYTLSIKGKFEKNSPTTSSGKGTFDVPGAGTVKATFTTDANQDGSSIMGIGSVSSGGQSVNFDLTGIKQVAAPVQTANAVETRKKPTGLIPDLTGNWVFQIQSAYGDYTLNTVIKAIDKAKTDFTGKGSTSGATINLKMGVRLRKVSELPELYALFHVSFAEAGNGRPIEAYDVVVNQTGTSLNLLGYYKPKKSTEEVVVSIVGNKTES